MFGSQDNNQVNQPTPVDNNPMSSPVMDNTAMPANPVPDMNMGMPSNDQPVQNMNSDFSSVPDLNSTAPVDQTVPTPVSEQEVASTDLSSNLTPASNDNPELEDLVLPSDHNEVKAPELPKLTDETSSDSDLDEIKNKALKEITPLLDKLDLPPLEKFKTIMMTIQAGDNKELIPSAYEAAEKIDNESEKAQALLDVINEINYFSSNKK